MATTPATPATLVSNIAARFLRVGEVVILRVGEVVTVGGFMRATITDVNAAWGDGYVRVVAMDSADQAWVVLYTKDQMVPLVDVAAADEALRAALAAL